MFVSTTVAIDKMFFITIIFNKYQKYKYIQFTISFNKEHAQPSLFNDADIYNRLSKHYACVI